MVNIGIIGSNGRMGQRIFALASEDHDLKVVARIDRDNANQLEELINDVDVFIDFSYAQASVENIKIIEKYKRPIVIGTTGLDENQKDIIRKVSKNIAVILAPNTSIGVNVFFKIVEETAKYLSDYDIELVELHHNNKKDSPSGTAVKIAEIVSKATGKSKNNWIYGREGLVEERPKEEIGIHAVRLGDVVGEHTLYFAGNSERIEITHRAHTRDNLAKGAILAAKWLFGKKPGMYDMFDVFEIK
jgi:4-hydroxy-tetrahydrodipicolinate reductase